MLYSILASVIRIFLKVFWQLKSSGDHFLNSNSGPVILAGNHTGWLDSFIVASASSRKVRFLAVDWVFKMPVLGLLTKALGGIPVAPKRGNEAIEKAVQCLKNGESVCIFPEGKLTEDGTLSKFHKGVAQIHHLSNCPVVPFAIYGGFEAWSYNKRFPSLHPIEIHFGVPFTKLDLPMNEEVNELSQIVGFMKDSISRKYSNNQEYLDGILGLTQSVSDTFAARSAVCMITDKTNIEFSYVELSRRASKLASYFIESGIASQSKIAFMTESRPEFAVSFFAGVRSGAIIVPIDIKLEQKELLSILQNCEPQIVIASSHCLDKILSIKDQLSFVKDIYCLDLDFKSGSKPEYESIKNIHELKPQKLIPSINRKLDETALIIYTSGTTGNPKGVMISYNNLVFQIQQFKEIINSNYDFSFLSILPINHLLELTHGFLSVLHAGGTIYYCPSLYPKDVFKLMQTRSIYGMFAVPLFYKTIKSGIEKEIHKSSSAQQLWWKIANDASLVLPFKSVRKILFGPILKKLGGKLEILISGGAPLDNAVAEFFNSIGLTILQGYGLTETSPVISFNTPNANKFGSVGKPLSNIEVKINSDSDHEEGEILTRGQHIMQGYYKQPELTKEVIDDEGWFHTGDIGKIDKDGFLFITGRIKNLIVLPGGKKVFPEEVETHLASLSCVKEVCVLGIKESLGPKAGQEKVLAVVSPSETFKSQFQSQDALNIELKKILEASYNDLAQYKRPTQLIILDKEFPKTALKKVKRNDLINMLENLKLI